MVARGTEFAVTLVVLGSVLASGFAGVAMAPGDGAGDRVCWFLVIAMLGAGCTGLALSAMYAGCLALTNRRVVDAPVFTLRSLLLVMLCYAVVCGLVVGSVPPQERGLLVSWAFFIMVQVLFLLGARNRQSNEADFEEVTRFSLLKRGFLLAACSGIVPILGWLIQFGLSCNESFGGGWQVGEFFLGLGYLLVFVLVPLELLAIAVVFVLLVRVRFYLSLALLLSAILLSTTYPVVHVSLF
jgi:hypothetical protein